MAQLGEQTDALVTLNPVTLNAYVESTDSVDQLQSCNNLSLQHTVEQPKVHVSFLNRLWVSNPVSSPQTAASGKERAQHVLI